MLRNRDVFVHTLGIDLKEVGFSLDSFAAEIQLAFSSSKVGGQQLFYNVPLELKRETLKGQEGDCWQIFTLQPDLSGDTSENSSRNVIRSEIYSSRNVIQSDNYYIGFCFSSDQTFLKEFATNLRSENFRHIMLSSSSFTRAFFDALKRTEYWIYELELSENAQKAFAEFRAEHALGLPKLGYPSSHYFTDPRELQLRQKFAESVVRYRNRINQTQTNTMYIGMSIQDILCPTGSISLDFNKRTIVQQMERAGFKKGSDKTTNKTVLFVGIGTGENYVALKEAWSDCIVVGVEPFPAAYFNGVGKNEELVFFLSVEELSDQPELVGAFDSIFILNLNVLSNEGDFWQAVAKLMKPEGEVFIGRHMGDPGYIASPKRTSEYLRENFGSLELVQLEQDEQELTSFRQSEKISVIGTEMVQFASGFSSYTCMDLEKDYFLVCMEAMLFSLKFDLPNESALEDTEVLLPYMQNCTQIFFRASKPRLCSDSDQKLSVFGNHMQALTREVYRAAVVCPERLYPVSLEHNKRAIEKYRSLRRSASEQSENKKPLQNAPIVFSYEETKQKLKDEAKPQGRTDSVVYNSSYRRVV